MSQEFLQCFLSPDNKVRQNAEAQLNNLVQTNLQGGLQLLGQGLYLPENELAEMASVLLCRLYLDKDEVFSQIPQQILVDLVQLGRQQLMLEGKLSYMKRICDLVVKILLRSERYNDMVDWVLSYPADTMNKKLTLMYFIEIMCEFAFDDDLLIKYSEPLNSVFDKYLNESEAQVRVAALKSLTSFLASVENSTTLHKFQGAVPLLLRKVIEAIQLDQVSSVSALQSLSELLESHPRFLQQNSDDLLQIFSEIMESTKMVPELRRASLHGLQTLCNTNPVQVRKSELFKQRTTVALMKMLTEVEGNQEDWENDLDDNCLQSQEISSSAQDCLAKISGDLNVKFLLPLFIKMIIPALHSKEWREQHAGLVAMAMLSEGSAKYFKNDLDSIIQSVIPLSQSANTRIHYDILTCIALLCQEFHPTIQQKYGQQIMQIVVACMQQTQSLKLQYRGISCLVDFCRELVDDSTIAQQVISPYAQGLLEVLYNQVQVNLAQVPLPDRESRIAKESLTALSVLAASLKENFATFYDTMQPIMTNVLQSIQVGEQYVEIRTLLIECIGFFLGSIAESRSNQFKSDSEKLMESFLSFQQTLTVDDQQHPALFSFYTQVAIGLKTEFAPFLGRVFDFVERAIKIDLGITIGDAIDNSLPEQSTNSKVARIKLDLKFVGLKSLELNTSALEQKIEGAHTLLQLTESCGKAFAPYLQRSIELVIKYISFKHSKDIRETMAQCVYFMMLCCNNSEAQSQLLNAVLPAVIKEAQQTIQKGDTGHSKTLMLSISDAVDIIQHPTMTEEIIDGILQLCASAMALCSKEKTSALKDFNSSEHDDEQQDKLNEDMEDIDDITDSIVTISTHLAKIYRQRVEPQLVNNLMPVFYHALSSPISLDAINSIAFFNGVLPYCSDQVFEKGFTQIAPIYVQKSKTNPNDLALQQNILYGIGEFAMRASNEAFKDLITVTIGMAQKIMNDSDSKSEDKVSSYETAVATLGKLGMFQRQGDMLVKFIENLPLEQTDAAETHLILLKEVQKQNPSLMNVQEMLKVKLQCIKNKDNQNPEDEILCDLGRQIINQLLC